MRIQVADSCTKVTKTKTGDHIILTGIINFLSFLTPCHKSAERPISPERIGVLIQWGLGDAVLVSPLLKALKEIYPHASIELIGNKWLDQLFTDEVYGDVFHPLNPPWTKFAEKYCFWRPEWRRYFRELIQLRSIKFDILISPRWDVRDSLQLRLLKATHKIGHASCGGKFWITRDSGLSKLENQSLHRAQINKSIFSSLADTEASVTPEISISKESLANAEDWLENQGLTDKKIIAVHGGAGNEIRRWGWDKFKTVLENLHPSIEGVVVLDDGESLLDPSDFENLKTPIKIWRGSISDLKGLLHKSELLLCCDSGVMHLAAAINCRTVSIFGPGSLTWFAPVGDFHQIVYVEDMPCRPCFDSCIYPTPLCMEGVTPGNVTNAMNTVLENRQT